MVDVPLPDPASAVVVVPAPGPGPGNWSGAASALRDGGYIYLSYRVRRPLNAGRGVSVVVARSSDGVRFEPLCEVARDQFGADSFERPCLVALADGRWRLYLSCATPGSKHWWVDSLTADTVAGLPSGQRAVVCPGDATVGVKDPVVVRDGDHWRMWLTCHPLTDPGDEDRMTTRCLTSRDGLSWVDEGEVLSGRPGEWDARGTRVTAVLHRDPLVLAYDGRPDAASNWHETTGLVVEGSAGFVRMPGARRRSPFSDGAFRYATVVAEDADNPTGPLRWYVETARADGAHDLVTMVTPALGDVRGPVAGQ
ncbi:MAG TPA: hypothetical protein VFN73_10020 [Propionibacteriaceae bacterium]|nr:hypothetical protein [Propionibacteriaceae bacterium]